MQSIWEDPFEWVKFIGSYPALQLVQSIWEPLSMQVRQWLRAEQSSTHDDPLKR